MLAINPKIKQKAEDIRNKIFGSEVRESLASGIEAISEDVEETIGRQDYVEEQFQNVIDETTDKDVISAPELIAARNGKSNLKTRLDEEHAQVTAQLQQKASITYVDALLMDVVKGGPKGVFYSIPELQTTYPTGAEGTWLVFDSSFGDGAHSFIWDNNNALWKDLGLYQATGIQNNSISFNNLKQDSKEMARKNYQDIVTSYTDGYFLYNVNTKLISINPVNSFQYSEPIYLKKGETISLRAQGYNNIVAMIVSCDQLGNKTVPLVVSVDSSSRLYEYTADENMYVRVSHQKIGFEFLGKSTQNSIEDLEGIYKPIYTKDVGHYVLASTGTLSPQAAHNASDIFTLKYGQKIIIDVTGATTENVVSLLSEWTESGTFIRNIQSLNSATTHVEYTPRKQIEYLRISRNTSANVKVRIVPFDLFKFKSEIESKEDLDFLKHLIFDVTIVGDSLMDGGYYGPGYTGAAIKESPPYFLEKLTDWTITDVSKNGASPISWWNDFGATTNYAKSDAVIIGLGTNAGLTDTMDTDVNVGTQTFANTQTGQYARIINAFRNANPKAHIFLVKVFASSGDVAITNTVIDKMATLFDCKILDESELFGNPVMHYNNAVHYGKVGNLYKAKLLLNQMTTHINDNLSDYEVLIDKF